MSDILYETLINQLVSSNTSWLDIGCGHSIFPNNQALSENLSNRCRVLVGLDPDSTILENPYVHEKAHCMLNQFETTRKFDLITFRMLAEHIEIPKETILRLRGLMTPNAKVVVYTPFLWSPIPILTRLVPFNPHHLIKKYFGGRQRIKILSGNIQDEYTHRFATLVSEWRNERVGFCIFEQLSNDALVSRGI